MSLYPAPSRARAEVLAKLLAKSGWKPAQLGIEPLSPAERERILRKLHLAYVQHRLVSKRGDL
jgi:hypothetical protein